MRYNVQGVDEATGKPRSVVVEAESAGEAMTLARAEGVRPRSVAAESPTASAPAGGRPDWPPANARGYPALRVLAVWYRIIAFLSAGVALVATIWGLRLMGDPGTRELGVLVVLAAVVWGAVSFVTLLALAEGIQLALDMASDLKEIRDDLNER